MHIWELNPTTCTRQSSWYRWFHIFSEQGWFLVMKVTFLPENRVGFVVLYLCISSTVECFHQKTFQKDILQTLWAEFFFQLVTITSVLNPFALLLCILWLYPFHTMTLLPNFSCFVGLLPSPSHGWLAQVKWPCNPASGSGLDSVLLILLSVLVPEPGRTKPTPSALFPSATSWRI